MKPVNLLPERHRPRTPTGGRQGSSYVLLGVLGAVLVAALIYVLTLNQINSRRDAVAQANNQTAAAKAQIQALGAYGNFVQVKDARVQAVKQLAEGRIDWEMAMRELGRVLPSDVWLVSADASTGDSDQASSSSATSAPPSTNASSGGAADTATLTLTGCAKSQDEVAVTLVRLRQMNGATDVTLNQSTATKSQGSSSSDSASGAGSCTPGTYQFQANVKLSNEHNDAGKVPASLGGGS